MKTSADSPLRIAAVSPGGSHGRIGVTLCPGKWQPEALAGPFDRDLDTDLDVIRDWGATAVVTLIQDDIEDDEFEELRLGRSHGAKGRRADHKDRFRQAVQDRHMEWWHLPITDGCTPGPDFEERWRVAGEALRDRLRLGFDVLVHCKGGLGRAGTVAARLLVELGVQSPEDAIDNVRDGRGPYAIEGYPRGGPVSQEEHVRRCTPQAASVPARTEDAIRDRALGAFLGLAVGDAVGTTLEFERRDENPRLEDMEGGGPFNLQAGEWTDDTSMAWALADSLAACGTLDAKDVMDRFLRWRNDGDYSSNGRFFDIGVTTADALERYEETGEPLAGSTHPRAAGNGSLMRLAPVALRFRNDRGALDAAAAEQSRTTHGAEEAVDACRAFAALLADAIAGTPRADLLAPRKFRGAEAITSIMAGSWRGRPRNEIRSSGYVVHTLEAALWCVARTADFRGAILLAANLADDADTVAAVAGQLAGALYGLEGIPRDWLDRLARREELLEVGERLLDAASS